LKGSKLSIVLEAITEEVDARYVKHSLGLSHHYLRDQPCLRSVCEAAGLFRSIRG
jgi:hypothetical protein